MPSTVMDTNCGLSQVAFCDSFDAASPGGRAGDLNDANWSFARLSSAVNVGQGMYNWFAPTDAMFCQRPISGVLPPQDSFFCNADGMEHMHWMTAINDAGSYVLDSTEARQPFDFAGRTGTVTFGVDAVTRGNHSWWPSVVITDQPVAGPHPVHPGEQVSPRSGISISFDNPCVQASPTTDATSVTVGDFERFDNYAQTVVPYTPTGNDPASCINVARDTMNRIQVRMSQQEIQVWGSDAGTDTLKLLADATNLNLPFTRGYVSLQQSHYNAAKFNGEAAHTYHWHDVGFDGPVLPTPRAYEAPDALTPVTITRLAGLNLGYHMQNSSIGPAFTLHNVDLTGASDAVLSFNATYIGLGGSVNYRFNGGPWRQVPYPMPTNADDWVGFVAPVAISDLRPGDNTLEFQPHGVVSWTPNDSVLANVDLEISAAASPTPTRSRLHSFDTDGHP